MDKEDRATIRSNLHQIDLLLRKLDRKVPSMHESAPMMHGLIQMIEDHKKLIYAVLDREAEKGA